MADTSYGHAINRLRNWAWAYVFEATVSSIWVQSDPSLRSKGQGDRTLGTVPYVWVSAKDWSGEIQLTILRTVFVSTN